MAKAKKKRPFSVHTFLSTVDGGRTVASYRKNQKIFSQGEPADSVFYIRDGKVKVYVVSEQGKRPSSRSTGTKTSSARVA
jgi:CRP/FNR family transcriptional regulator, cyclic AMP receptor protein